MDGESLTDRAMDEIEQSMCMDGLTYGVDLWDNLNVVKESTDQRCKQMQGLKNFFKQYKKAIDQFKDGVKKALVQFEKDIIAP